MPSDSKSPVGPKSPYSSEPPISGGTEIPEVEMVRRVDLFITDLLSEKQVDEELAILSRDKRLSILSKYMNIGGADYRRALILRAMHGEAFNLVAAKVQNLIDECNSSFDEICVVIMERLEVLKTASESAPKAPTAVREEVKQVIVSPESEVVSPDADTVFSSRPPESASNLLLSEIDALLDKLSDDERHALLNCKTLDDMMVHDSIDLESAMDLQLDIRSLMGEYELTEEKIRQLISERHQAAKAIDERKKAIISHTPLSSEMSNEKFVASLTDEGRQMADELLLLDLNENWDIRNAGDVQALEEQHGKEGYVRLSMHVIDRISSAESKKELCEALKGDDGKGAAHTEKEEGDDMTLSPWDTRQSAEEVSSASKPSLAQLLDKLPEESLRILERDMLENEDGQPGAATARFFQQMINNGLNPNTHFDELRELLIERAINVEAPEIIKGFVETVLADDKMEVLKACVKVNGNDRSAVNKLGVKYGPDFWGMSNRLRKLQKKLGCSEGYLRNALKIHLKGGVIVSEQDDSREKDAVPSSTGVKAVTGASAAIAKLRLRLVKKNGNS